MFSISCFHALMNQLPRGAWDQAVAAHQADKHTKRFSRWNHLQVMIYAQLAGATSLRSVVHGFNAHASHHYHLGAAPVKRSTLADANAKVSPQLFIDLLQALMAYVPRQLRRQGQRWLSLLDSTSFTLKGHRFDAWTHAHRTSHTQGLKLHVLYETDVHAPSMSSFTPANVNDVEEGRRLHVQPGRRYVFDKGYCDYAWWHALDAAGATFVTRFKRNAALKVQAARAIPKKHTGIILADEKVTFAHKHNRARHTNPYYDRPLRRITVARPDHKTPLILATNDMHRPAREIAEDYRARWGIELFFKWIKQHLRIKAFYGTSENAVKTQLWIAVCVYVLIAIIKKRLNLRASLYELLQILSLTMFERTPLGQLLAQSPPLTNHPSTSNQLFLFQ